MNAAIIDSKINIHLIFQPRNYIISIITGIKSYNKENKNMKNKQRNWVLCGRKVHETRLITVLSFYGIR